MPLHDLTIKTIASYIKNHNYTMVGLQKVNKRFYSLRDVFIRRLTLTYDRHKITNRHRHYGWNKVHDITIYTSHEHLVNCIELKDIRKVKLVYGLFENLFALNSIHTLVLEYCGENVNDISFLGKLREIKLNRCHGITDFSALSSVKKVSIEHCKGLTDTSLKVLSNNHTLVIYDCEIEDISCLKNVRDLTLRTCRHIRDVSSLGTGTIKKLYLGCMNIEDISTLGTIHTLIMDGLPINDVSWLKNVHTLTISQCNLIDDISDLKNVHKLCLYDCPSINTVGMLNSVHSLTITECHNIKDLFSLNNKKLRINSCKVTLAKDN